MRPMRSAVSALPWRTLLLFNLVVVPFSLQGIHAGDTDMFYHLAGGRYMVEQQRILDREIFSFTIPNEPWTNYYWLFQYVLFRLYRLGGFTALIAFRALLVILTTNLVFYWIYRRTRGSSLVTLAFALAAFALYLSRDVNIRPHLVSYLFLIVSLLLLDRFQRAQGRFEPWLPILCVLWANFHGIEYPIVLTVIAVYGLSATYPHTIADQATPPGDGLRSRAVLRWPLLFLLCGLAFLANPFGASVFATPRIALNQEGMAYINEMRSYDWRTILNLFPRLDLGAPAIFHYLLLSAFIALPGWISRAQVGPILLTLVATGLAFNRIRFLAEFAILVPAFVAESVSRYRTKPGVRAWPINVGLAALICYLGLASSITLWSRFERGHFRQLSTRNYPIGAARFLQAEGLRGNLLSDPTFAGYIEWVLYPDVRIAMDMRTPDPFNARIHWLLQSVTDPARLGELETRWPIDFVLARPWLPLARRLARQPDSSFVLTHADASFVLFTHRRILAGGRENLALKVFNPFDTSMGYVGRLAEPAKRDALRLELHRLLEVWPGNELAHQTELELMLAFGSPADAHGKAVKLMSAYPREARYPYAAGMALKALKQQAAAAEQFEKALRLDRDFIPTYPALAEASFRLARYQRGLDVMEEYLQRKSYSLTASEYFLLGNLRDRAGTKVAAADAYERAMWLTPAGDRFRSDIENKLGSVYVDLEQPEKALPLLEAALGRTSPFHEAELNRARAWAKLGKAEAARHAFQRLAEDESVPPPIRSKALSELRNEHRS